MKHIHNAFLWPSSSCALLSYLPRLCSRRLCPPTCLVSHSIRRWLQGQSNGALGVPGSRCRCRCRCRSGYGRKSDGTLGLYGSDAEAEAEAYLGGRDDHIDQSRYESRYICKTKQIGLSRSQSHHHLIMHLACHQTLCYSLYRMLASDVYALGLPRADHNREAQYCEKGTTSTSASL